MQTVNKIADYVLGFYSRVRSAYLARNALKNQRLLFNLKSSTGKPSGSIFLDLGCGVGAVSVLAAKEGLKVYALDPDIESLSYEQELKTGLGINVILADGQSLPFCEESFDIIYCCHVLEHVDDDSSFLTEIFRILKEDGVLLLAVPNIHNLSTRFKRKMNIGNQLVTSEHMREYNKDGLTGLLNGCGFYVVDLHMTGFLLPFGNTILNFAVLQFNLARLKGYLAARFPNSSESIDVVVMKNDGWKGLKSTESQLFPLPWWLRSNN